MTNDKGNQNMNEVVGEKRLFVWRDWASPLLEVGLVVHDRMGRKTWAPEVVMKEIDPVAGQRVEPIMRLEQVDAQQLMDGLYQAGVRPTEGAGSAGAFAAQGAHLKDLQRMVFEQRPETLMALREIALKVTDQ